MIEESARMRETNIRCSQSIPFCVRWDFIACCLSPRLLILVAVTLLTAFLFNSPFDGGVTGVHVALHICVNLVGAVPLRSRLPESLEPPP